MLLGATVLVAAAWLRGAEYDEQYTLFLTAGTARPAWPDGVFPAGAVAALQAGHTSLGRIAADLRATDVHPPLYFWAVSLWRNTFGPGLFVARLLAVLCGLGSLWLVGVIARQCRIPPVPAILLTLGCYGFAYTNAIARGFAPAEMMTLCGFALLLARRPLLAGLAFGIACGCNYLAVFVAIAACVVAGAWLALPAAAPFLALDAWFFAAQHAARPDQFPPFQVLHSVIRLAGYQVAAVFGGLPLYFDGLARIVVGGIVGVAAIGLIWRIARTRPFTSERRLLLAAAVAPPIGLLVLGAVFNNTPIELRYLSFGLPFLALLAAGQTRKARNVSPGLRSNLTDPCYPTLTSKLDFSTENRENHEGTRSNEASLPIKRPLTEPETPDAPHTPPNPQALRAKRHSFSLRGPPWSSYVLRAKNLACLQQIKRPDLSHLDTKTNHHTLQTIILTLQTAGILGLLLAPKTMQPARAAAAQAARFADNAIALLPAGNDGVGIVGAFAIEAPPTLNLLLVHPTDPPISMPEQYNRVILCLLAQDHDSTAALPILRAAVSAPNWRRIAIGSNLEVYERTDPGE